MLLLPRTCSILRKLVEEIPGCFLLLCCTHSLLAVLQPSRVQTLAFLFVCEMQRESTSEAGGQLPQLLYRPSFFFSR